MKPTARVFMKRRREGNEENSSEVKKIRSEENQKGRKSERKKIRREENQKLKKSEVKKSEVKKIRSTYLVQTSSPHNPNPELKHS